MTHRPLLVLSFVPLAACPGSPWQAFQACPTAPCRQAAVVEAFADAPDEVRAWIRDCPDPVEQAVLAETLAAARPEAAGPLCDLLPDGTPGADACARHAVRPHLFTSQPKQVDTAPAPWDAGDVQAAAPVELPCGDDGACIREEATRRALAGDLRAAGVACGVRSGGTARDDGAPKDLPPAVAECLFQVAERVVERQGHAGLPASLDLCVHAGFTSPMCLSHVILRVGGPSATGHRSLRARVAEAATVAGILRSHLGDQHATDVIVDRFWSAWTFTSTHVAPAVTGDLLDHVPPEALPHARMATTWAALRGAWGHPDTPTDLEGLVRLAAEALDRRGVGDLPPLPGATLVEQGEGVLWTADRPGEEQVPAVYCMGPGRRAVADDPSVGLQIAVLETTARLSPPPPPSLYADVLGSDRPEYVRWTAARIGRALYPDLAPPRPDPSPLVQARLTTAPDTALPVSAPPPPQSAPELDAVRRQHRPGPSGRRSPSAGT